MTLLLKVQANTQGQDYYVTDVHGQFTALRIALDAAGFNPSVDRLFFGGDLVDRGPESHLSLQWLQQPWAWSVQGNHELMTIDSVKGPFLKQFHIKYGGLWFHGEGFDQQPYINAFEALPVAIELTLGDKIIGIVHADCAGTNWQKFISVIEGSYGQGEADNYLAIAQWSKSRVDNCWDSEIEGIDMVLIGHTIVDQPEFYGPNVLAMDTGCASYVNGAGKLTLLNLHTRKTYCVDLPTKVVSEGSVEFPF